ncbi:MAG: hypothetical protein KKE16_05400 [Firmicutes bacterium]|nr:hypothetical protein [Bacillota bacterium]
MKSTKSRFYDFLSRSTDFSGDYSKIEEKITLPTLNSSFVDQKTHGFQIQKKIILTSLILLAVVTSIFVYRITQNDTRFLSKPDLAYNPFDINETVSFFNYIFIGKIGSLSETSTYDGSGTEISYSIFSIDQIQYLKGKGDSSSELVFYGGENSSGVMEMYEGVTELPVESEYYLFIANKAYESTTRVKEGQFIVSLGNYQMIKLSNFNPNLPIDQQSSENMDIVKPYAEIAQLYTLLDQLGLYSNTNDLVGDLSNIVFSSSQNVNDFNEFGIILNPLTYLTTFISMEKNFLVFISGSIAEVNSKVFIIEFTEYNGKVFLSKTNISSPSLPHAYVFSTIDFYVSEEISFDSREIVIYSQSNYYSFGFSILNNFSDKHIYYNEIECERLPIEFSQGGVVYNITFCYAVSTSFESRTFSFVDPYI